MKKYASSLVLLLVTGFYLWSLAPTIIAGDSASFCVAVYKFSLEFGKASDHPLYILIGKLFSFLPFEMAFSLNLMSALFGALTAWLLFLTVRQLTNSDLPAFLGSCALMVSHAFWQHSVIAEVYTMNAFFLMLLIWLCIAQMKRRSFLLLFLLVFLLGLLNHLILILSLPAFLLYILLTIEARTRKKLLLLAGSLLALFCVGGLFLFLARPQVVKAWVHAILVGPPPIYYYLFPPSGLKPFLKELLFYLLYLGYQYPLGGILLGIFGILRLLRRKPAVASLLLLIIALNALFFIKSTFWASYGGTKYTFYISDYTVFAIFVGYGADAVFRRIEHWTGRLRAHKIAASLSAAAVILTIVFYAMIPHVVTYLDLDLLHARSLPYRNNARFFLNPNKRGYYGDRKFGEELFALAAKDSIVFADFTPYTILRYLAVIEGKRPDIKLVVCDERMKLHKRIDGIKSIRPDAKIYLADKNSYYNLDGLEEKYQIQAYGPFFGVVEK